MYLVQIGSKIINLEHVALINLEDYGPPGQASAICVGLYLSNGKRSTLELPPERIYLYGKEATAFKEWLQQRTGFIRQFGILVEEVPLGVESKAQG